MAITWKKLAYSGDAPTAHKASHENTGGDEVSVAGLSGLLADDQHVLDAEAKAAAVQSGAITNGVTKAPTHDAVYDVKVTADAAQTAAEVDADIATHAALATAGTHGSTTAATANKLAHRDASGRAKFAAPGAAGDALIKGTRVTTAELPAMTDEKIWKGTGGNVEEVDMPSSEAGEGHITIFPINYSSIGQGIWILNIQALALTCGYFANTGSGVDGDNISYKVFLQAGTYTLRMIYSSGDLYGIVDIDIDGVEVTSVDTYTAGVIWNVIHTETGIVIATSGLKTLKLRIDGKNGSSTNYFMVPSLICLWRTA